MCTHARIPSASRRNESASSKSFAVSGSTVYVGSSRRSTRFGSSAAGGSCGSNGCRAPRSTRSASRTFSIRAELPSACSTCARPFPGRTTARSPGSRSPSPFDSSTSGIAGREVRLADDELAASADLDYERSLRREGSGGSSGPSRRRRAQAGAEEHQRHQRERHRVHVGVTGQVGHDRRQSHRLAERPGRRSREAHRRRRR